MNKQDLLDMFACEAMAAIIQSFNSSIGEARVKQVAIDSYYIAKIMLAEREKHLIKD